MLIRWGTDGVRMTFSNARPRRSQPRAKFAQSKRKANSARRREKSAELLSRNTKEDTAKLAKRRFQVKASVKSREPPRSSYSFVYVGNLQSTVTPLRLKSFFASCGEITQVALRCSRGQAVTMGVAVPSKVRTARDRQYASVEFADSKAATRALQLNGHQLDGCKIVVTISPADLPEAKEIIQGKLKSLCTQNGSQPAESSSSRRQPLEAQATEPIINPDRHRIFGISFAKCIA